MESTIAKKLTSYPQSVKDLRQHFEVALQETLNRYQDIPQPLYEPIAYVLNHGGKRVRPLLVYLAGQLRHVDQCFLDSIALAVELIHS